MNVFIDTNILISAALSPAGTPAMAFMKAVTYPNKAMLSEQNLDELRRIFNRKFPNKIGALEAFLALALTVITIVPTPEEKHASEQAIRDVADRPILRSAIHAGADILLTGNKDFLESGIGHPRIMTAAEFLYWVTSKMLRNVGWIFCPGLAEPKEVYWRYID